ncbi:tetratricopeptide repeat protein [Streptomyces sp. NPDC002896]|uniref:tetratricopeptide repeat protein n=1 Tax=Streptomyces sp. NPDC002896 TaxID=3154438 RepID=UPI003332EE1B
MAAEEAITIGRRWTEDGDLTDRDVELAGALHNLSLALADFGRHADAVAPAQEALEIRRQQAQSAPGAFEKDFADPLIHLSTRQRKAGSLEEAVEQAEDGVEVFRRLAAEDPVAHEHALCDALARLGLALVAVGRTEAAREIHAQAAALTAAYR